MAFGRVSLQLIAFLVFGKIAVELDDRNVFNSPFSPIYFGGISIWVLASMLEAMSRDSKTQTFPQLWWVLLVMHYVFYVPYWLNTGANYVSGSAFVSDFFHGYIWKPPAYRYDPSYVDPDYPVSVWAATNKPVQISDYRR